MMAVINTTKSMRALALYLDSLWSDMNVPHDEVKELINIVFEQLLYNLNTYDIQPAYQEVISLIPETYIDTEVDLSKKLAKALSALTGVITLNGEGPFEIGCTYTESKMYIYIDFI